MAEHAHITPDILPRRPGAPSCAPPLAPVICPTRRQMRAAYRRNGDPIPANLRGGFFQGWMA